MSNQLIYDQPFNETIRVCLRLEQLFQSIDHQMNELSIPGTRQLIHLIINLLHLLDRPDLKSKLAKEFTQSSGAHRHGRRDPNSKNIIR